MYGQHSHTYRSIGSCLISPAGEVQQRRPASPRRGTIHFALDLAMGKAWIRDEDENLLSHFQAKAWCWSGGPFTESLYAITSHTSLSPGFRKRYSDQQNLCRRNRHHIRPFLGCIAAWSYLSWINRNRGSSGLTLDTSSTPIARIVPDLWLNIVVSLCTESLGHVHSRSVRWAPH